MYGEMAITDIGFGHESYVITKDLIVSLNTESPR